MGLATYTYNRSTSGGEIITHLINSTDGTGLHFDGAAGFVEFTPADLGTKFSFEFIAQADSWSTQQFLVDFGTVGRFVFAGLTAESLNLSIFDGTSWKSLGVKVLDDLKVHHLTLTIDGTAAILYDNANQVGTATISAAHAIDSTTVARLGAEYNTVDNLFDGTLYRARFWNKTLSQAEVTASYENATVPFSDQYSSLASPLMAGTLTSGKLYRITTYVSGDDFTNLGGTNVTGNEFVTTGTTPTDWSNGSSLIQIGCTADFDLAFANPTQSLMVQDRAGAADGTSSATGVSQVTPLVQVNATAARIGTTAATPADGDLLVSGKVGVGQVTPVSNVHISYADTSTPNLRLTNSTTGHTAGDGVELGYSTSGGAFLINHENSDFAFKTDGATRLTIDSVGKVLVAGTTAIAAFGTHAWAPALQQLGSQGIASVRTETSEWGGALHLASSNGTAASPTAAADDDAAGAVYFEAYDGTDFKNYVGGIECQLDGAVASNDTPGRLVFSTAADGANTLTERLRIDSAGLATFANGIAFQSATTGTGTGTNYSLSKYEIGKWTGAFTAGTGTITIDTSNNEATYVRVGDLVHVEGRFGVSAISSGPSPSGTFGITGLPFTGVVNTVVNGETISVGPCYLENANGALTSPIMFGPNSTNNYLQVRSSGTTGAGDSTANHVDTGTFILFSCTYRCAP